MKKLINNNYIKLIEIFSNKSRYFLFIPLFIASVMWTISIAGIYYNLNDLLIFLSLIISLLVSTCLCKHSQSKNFFDFDMHGDQTLNYLLLLTIFLVVFIPPLSGDEIAYSASLPKNYAASRSFYYNDDYGPYSAFPQNYEAITTLSMMFFNSPIIAKLSNFIMTCSLFTAAFIISYRVGNEIFFSRLVSILILASTAYFFNIPIAKNDIANAFFQTWSLAIIVLLIKNKSLLLSIFLGIFLGTTISVKYNSLLFAGVIALSYLFILFDSELTFKSKIKHFFIFIFTFILFSFPWYLNNWLLFSNPIYPIKNDLFNPYGSFNKSYTLIFDELFHSDLQNFSWSSGTIIGFFKKLFNEFGFIVCLFGFSGLLINLFKPKNRSIFILSLIALSLLIVNLRFGFWEPRYLLSILVLLAVLSITTINIFNFDITKIKNISTIITYLCFLFSFIRVLEFYGPVELAFVRYPLDTFSRKYIPGWEVADYLNTHTGVNSKIAIGVGSNQVFYYLNRSYYHIHPLTEKGNLLSINNGEEFYRLLQNQEVDFLAISNLRFRSPNIATPNLNSFFNRLNISIYELIESNKLKKITQIDDVIIYRLENKKSN